MSIDCDRCGHPQADHDYSDIWSDWARCKADGCPCDDFEEPDPMCDGTGWMTFGKFGPQLRCAGCDKCAPGTEETTSINREQYEWLLKKAKP